MSVARVENELSRAGFEPARRRRYGYLAEYDADGGVLVHWANDVQVADLNDRLDRLMAMREVLLRRFEVNLYGTHHHDGRPVCLVVRERVVTTHETTALLDLTAS